MELSKKGFAKRHLVERDSKTHRVTKVTRVARVRDYDRMATYIRAWRG